MTDSTTVAGAPFAGRYRVRFDEAGPDGLLRTSGLLRFAQDVAWVHSEARGFDRAWYAGHGLGWLVRGAELEVVRPIPLGAELEVTTEVVGWRKVWARRRSEVLVPGVGLAAWVHTDWVLIDDRGAVARIPPDFVAFFPGPQSSEAITRVPLAPPPDAHRAPLVVRRHELDPNDHANNAAFLDWLEEAIAACPGPDAASALAAIPRRYRLEYVAPVVAGSGFERLTWRDDEGWASVLLGPDGSTRFAARLVR